MNDTLAVQKIPESKPIPMSVFSTAGDSFVMAQRMAKALSTSTMVPNDYRGEENIGNCLIALDIANRLGASPLSIMQHMVPINGRPAWSATFLIGTVNSCGRFTPLRYEAQGTEGRDDWGVRAVARDKITNETLRGSLITIGMAKAEGWYGRKGSKWQTMPEQMLQYRAASFWTRAYAPELSLGMQTREDVIDIEPEPVKAPGQRRKQDTIAMPKTEQLENENEPEPEVVGELTTSVERLQMRLTESAIPYTYVQELMSQGDLIKGCTEIPIEALTEEQISAIDKHWGMIVKVWKKQAKA